METSAAKIHTKALPRELQSYIHEDFKANESYYWKIRNSLLKTYSGKWVAINDGKVISASKNIFEVTRQVGKEKCHAFITKVGEEDKVVLKRRRVQFNYDADYPGFAMPQAHVTFSNFSQSASAKFENVIPDTGSDGTGLPISDCEKIQLFESPYLLSSSSGECDRLLGRDVLNQLTTIFRGTENKIIFIKSRKR